MTSIRRLMMEMQVCPLRFKDTFVEQRFQTQVGPQRRAHIVGHGLVVLLLLVMLTAASAVLLNPRGVYDYILFCMAHLVTCFVVLAPVLVLWIVSGKVTKVEIDGGDGGETKIEISSFYDMEDTTKIHICGRVMNPMNIYWYVAFVYKLLLIVPPLILLRYEDTEWTVFTFGALMALLDYFIFVFTDIRWSIAIIVQSEVLYILMALYGYAYGHNVTSIVVPGLATVFFFGRVRVRELQQRWMFMTNPHNMGSEEARTSMETIVDVLRRIRLRMDDDRVVKEVDDCISLIIRTPDLYAISIKKGHEAQEVFDSISGGKLQVGQPHLRSTFSVANARDTIRRDPTMIDPGGGIPTSLHRRATFARRPLDPPNPEFDMPAVCYIRGAGTDLEFDFLAWGYTHRVPIFSMGMVLLAKFSSAIFEGIPLPTSHNRLESLDTGGSLGSDIKGLRSNLRSLITLSRGFNTEIAREFMINLDKTMNPYLPYHNKLHGAMVAHYVHAFCIHIGLSKTQFYTSRTCLLMTIASLGHDAAHAGRNSGFLIRTYHPLAMAYNDGPVLEQYHCAMVFLTMEKPNSNILYFLNDDGFFEARHRILDLILATDMASHFQIISTNRTYRGGGAYDPAENAEDFWYALKLVIKTSDLAPSSFTPPNHLHFTYCVQFEFYTQGDEEGRLGIAKSPLCDRDIHATSFSSTQFGFINYIATPLYEELEAIGTPTKSFLKLKDRLYSNRTYWDNKKTSELSDPPLPPCIEHLARKVPKKYRPAQWRRRMALEWSMGLRKAITSHGGPGFQGRQIEVEDVPGSGSDTDVNGSDIPDMAEDFYMDSIELGVVVPQLDDIEGLSFEVLEGLPFELLSGNDTFIELIPPIDPKPTTP